MWMPARVSAAEFTATSMSAATCSYCPAVGIPHQQRDIVHAHPSPSGRARARQRRRRHRAAGWDGGSGMRGILPVRARTPAGTVRSAAGDDAAAPGQVSRDHEVGERPSAQACSRSRTSRPAGAGQRTVVRRGPALQQARGPGPDRFVAGLGADRIGTAASPWRNRRSASRPYTTLRGGGGDGGGSEAMANRVTPDAGHALGEGLQPDRRLVRIRRRAAAREHAGIESASGSTAPAASAARCRADAGAHPWPSPAIPPATRPACLAGAGPLPAQVAYRSLIQAQGKPRRGHPRAVPRDERLRHRPFRPVFAPLAMNSRGAASMSITATVTDLSRSAAASANASLPHSAGLPGQAIAPQRDHRAHAGRARGLDVAGRRRRRRNRRCRRQRLRHVQQRQQVRLALGQAVAADEHSAARVPAEQRQHLPGEYSGLLVTMPQRLPAASSVQQFGHAIERAGRACRVRLRGCRGTHGSPDGTSPPSSGTAALIARANRDDAGRSSADIGPRPRWRVRSSRVATMSGALSSSVPSRSNSASLGKRDS